MRLESYGELDLTEKHLLEWGKSNIDELRQILEDKFEKTFDLPKDRIKDIIASGSRVYKVGTLTNFFMKESDLDCAILIDPETFDKFFLPVNEMLASRYYISKLQEQYPDKFRPRIRGFYFNKVRISIFIFPYNLDEKDKNTRFIHKYNLPFYSFYEHKYYDGDIYETIEYLSSIKVRLRKNKFCYICQREVPTPISITLIPRIPENLKVIFDKTKFLKLKMIHMCKDCFEEIFSSSGRGMSEIIDFLKEKK